MVSSIPRAVRSDEIDSVSISGHLCDRCITTGQVEYGRNASPGNAIHRPQWKEVVLVVAAIEDIRARTFQLTCLCGITGRPAVSTLLAIHELWIGL